MLYRRDHGVSNPEYGILLAPYSAFHVAPASKQFTAMPLALPVEEGHVSWQDDHRSSVP